MQKQISWLIGKRDGPSNPVLLKFGVALAFSLGGIFLTYIGSKRIMLPKPSLPSPGKDRQAESEAVADHLALENSLIPTVPSSSITDISSSGGRSVGETEGFLASEFDHLVKEYNMATHDVSKRKNVEQPEEQERELRSLRSKVEILEEREKMLENQLVEYYGLKEQANALLELQSRLSVHNIEAKMSNLKIESLQSENKKLKAKVADYEKVVAELESSQAKIKLLKKKLVLEAEQNREQILKLQASVVKLQDQEKKAIEIDRDMDSKSQETIRLKEELEEMKEHNHSLKLQNLELAHKVEKLQMLAEKSALDDKEVERLREESEVLRQQNENFRQKIDQLQANRCTDVEELVYLKWINACLRYEMRNYKPGPNETIARDLSKSLSPKSEEKAKGLILAYANTQGSGIKNMSIGDFDCEEWSISPSSCLTDSSEPDDLPADSLQDSRANHPSKKKVFAKLMKLLRGKDNDHHVHTPSPLRERAASVDDIVRRYSVTSRSDRSRKFDGHAKTTTTSRRISDDGSLSIFRTTDSMIGHDGNSSSGFLAGREAQSAPRTEVVKYAEALKSSRPSSFLRRSASFASF